MKKTCDRKCRLSLNNRRSKKSFRSNKSSTRSARSARSVSSKKGKKSACQFYVRKALRIKKKCLLNSWFGKPGSSDLIGLQKKLLSGLKGILYQKNKVGVDFGGCVNKVHDAFFKVNDIFPLDQPTYERFVGFLKGKNVKTLIGLGSHNAFLERLLSLDNFKVVKAYSYYNVRYYDTIYEKIKKLYEKKKKGSVRSRSSSRPPSRASSVRSSSSSSVVRSKSVNIKSSVGGGKQLEQITIKEIRSMKMKEKVQELLNEQPGKEEREKVDKLLDKNKYLNQPYMHIEKMRNLIFEDVDLAIVRVKEGVVEIDQLRKIVKALCKHCKNLVFIGDLKSKGMLAAIDEATKLKERKMKMMRKLSYGAQEQAFVFV